MATQAEWNKLFTAIGLALNAFRQMAAFSQSFFGYEDVVYVNLDQANDIRFIKLDGIKKGENTDSEGFLYVDKDLNGSDKRLRIYKDSGLTSLVATAQGTLAADELVDVTENNSSGITGKSYFAHTTDDSDIFLTIRFNVPSLSDEFDPKAGTPDLSDDYSSFMNALGTTGRAVGADLVAKAGLFRDLMSDALFVGAVAEFIQSGYRISGTLLDATPNTVGGQLAWTYRGILPDLYKAMSDDSQLLKKTTASIGAAVAGSLNTGALTFQSKTAREYAEDGDTVRVECLTELGTTELEKFAVSTVKRGQESYRATLRQGFDSRALGLYLLLRRSMTLSGAGSSYLTVPTITGENTTNIDATNGVLYGELIKSGSTRRVKLYTSTNRLTSELVSDSGDVTDSEPFTIETLGVGNSTLAMTFLLNTGAAGDATYDFEVALNLPKKGDYWELPVTSDERGTFSTVLGRVFQYELPTDLSSPTIDDRLAHTWNDREKGILSV